MIICTIRCFRDEMNRDNGVEGVAELYPFLSNKPNTFSPLLFISHQNLMG